MDTSTEMIVEQCIDLLHENNLSCILNSISNTGYPYATVIKPICGLGIETIYFILGNNAELVKNYACNTKSSITYCGGENSVYITGNVFVISAEDLCQDVTDKHLFSTCVPNRSVLLKFVTQEAQIHIGETNHVMKI